MFEREKKNNTLSKLHKNLNLRTQIFIKWDWWL